MRPGPAPDENSPAPLPPEIERRLRELSPPPRAADPYVLAPPPRPAPPATARVVETAGRAADAGLAAVAHFAILFGFLGIGFLLSLAVSGVIWLYSRRSPYVEFHAKQAGCYQLFVIGINIGWGVLLGVLLWCSLFLGWAWAGVAAMLLFVVALAWFVLSILYGAWAGLQVLLGRDFRYPYFGRPTTKQ